MIVLDEAIHGPGVAGPIADWYTGQVISINRLRPATLVKDEAIPALLRTVSRPTFVTLNVNDFWRRTPPNARYCILCFELPAPDILKMPGLLRLIFRMPEFNTKALRMGKIMRVYASRIDYYAADRELHTLLLPK